MSRLSLAKNIMVTKLVTVAPDDDVLQGIELLLRHRITGAPVLGDDRQYLGMLSETSCMRVLFLTAREVGQAQQPPPRARDFMAKKLLTLRPETDAIEAISMLLKNRFAGASVVDEDNNFLGVFSEHYVMRLLVNSAYEQVPSPRVEEFMNTDRDRLIDEETNILEVAQMFLDTHYRRLPVLREGKLVGQVSRRDVLTAEHQLSRYLKGRRKALLDHRRGEILADVWHHDGEEISTRVSRFMDTSAETIEEDLDFLTIAQIFLGSIRRRLPVLRDGKQIGQISRRDLLLAVLDQLWKQPQPKQSGLYLSAVMEPGGENPFLK